MRKVPKSLLLDKLHYGFVLTCAGVSVLATLQLFSYIGNFYTEVKPQHEEMQKKELEKLLQEGRDIVNEMKDTAPTLTP